MLPHCLWQSPSSGWDALPLDSTAADTFNHFVDSLVIEQKIRLGRGGTDRQVYNVSATPGTNNADHFRSIRNAVINTKFHTTFSGNGHTSNNAFLYKIC